MRLPGFTADVTLYRSKHHYRTAGESRLVSVGPSVVAALDHPCELEFVECARKCGIRSDSLFSLRCYEICGAIYGDCQCELSGKAICNYRCVDLLTDPDHCGDCDVSCYGAPCNNGTCCSSGSTTLCPDGSCTDTNTDPNNCGGCGNACSSGETCQTGTCCAGETIVCGGTLICPSTEENCGACGMSCACCPQGLTSNGQIIYGCCTCDQLGTCG